MGKAKAKNPEICPVSTVVDPATGAPMNPWRYSGRPFTIGYAEVPAGNSIGWVKSGPFWVSLRTVCLGINWHDLNRLGFISGRPIMIGGQHYLCRSVRVCELPWIFGANLHDEEVWHWGKGYFWCWDDASEIPDDVEDFRPASGFIFMGKSTTVKSTQPAGLGFRPVLEELGPALPLEDITTGHPVTLYGLGGSVSGRVVEVSGYDLVLDPWPGKLPQKKPWLMTMRGGLVAVVRSAILHIEDNKKEDK